MLPFPDTPTQHTATRLNGTFSAIIDPWDHTGRSSSYLINFNLFIKKVNYSSEYIGSIIRSCGSIRSIGRNNRVIVQIKIRIICPRIPRIGQLRTVIPPRPLEAFARTGVVVTNAPIAAVDVAHITQPPHLPPSELNHHAVNSLRLPKAVRFDLIRIGVVPRRTAPEGTIRSEIFAQLLLPTFVSHRPTRVAETPIHDVVIPRLRVVFLLAVFALVRGGALRPHDGEFLHAEALAVSGAVIRTPQTLTRASGEGGETRTQTGLSIAQSAVATLCRGVRFGRRGGDVHDGLAHRTGHLETTGIHISTLRDRVVPHPEPLVAVTLL